MNIVIDIDGRMCPRGGHPDSLPKFSLVPDRILSIGADENESIVVHYSCPCGYAENVTFDKKKS